MTTIDRSKVLACAFSPLRTYFVTWERWEKGSDPKTNGNLIVWNLTTGEIEARFPQVSSHLLVLTKDFPYSVIERFLISSVLFFAEKICS